MIAPRLAALLLCGSTLAAPVAAEVLDSSTSGFTVQNVVTVSVKPAQAWRALVRDVDAWWPKDHSWFGKDGRFSIEARAGGCFCEIAGDRQAEHMRIGFVEPGVLLRMLGGLGPLQGMGLQGTLDWKLQPVDGGTRITLRYVAGGYTPQDMRQFAPVVDGVQALQLGGLAKHLSAGK